jgi:hypothetical protein
MLSLARILVSSVAAYLVYGLGGAAMLAIPGTPHYRLLQQMFVLDSYRNTPALDAANAAFDEWLRIGRQAEWVNATILTALAARAVLLLWRRKRPLSALETLSIVAVFAAGVMWRLGSADVDAPLVTTVFVFTFVLSAAKVRQILGGFSI